MAGKLKTREELRATRTLGDVIAEGQAFRKGKRGIDKKSVMVHKGADSTGTMTQAPGVPTAEQLAEINKYTRSPKSADELYVLHTLSANTLPDRDDDYFDADTLKGFAELEQPFSPTGKSYMVGHDYEQLPTGRIFGTGTDKVDGVDFLTNEVYIPNTESNKSFIEAVDFGVNWAVSVGVLLEAQLCSICEAPQMGGWFYGGLCTNGHWKGEYYDPAATETDSWGDIIPADPSDPKAVKCLGNMKGAKDFYELSQVFLGAQFFAALDQSKGVVKALKGVKSSVPILGLSRKDAAELPLQHTDPKVAEAFNEYEVEHHKDGSLSWVDNQKLVWSYTPGDEVLCLGKKAEDEKEIEEDNDGEESDGTTGSAGEGGSEDGVGEADDDGERDDEEGEDALDEESGDGAQLGANGDLTDKDADEGGSDNTDEDEDTTMDKAVILAALRAAKLPSKYRSAVEQASDNGLTAVLRAVSQDFSAMSATIDDLTPRATMGDAYKSSLRADAIDWYTKAKGMGTQRGVDVSGFEKILDGCGDNIELIKSLTNDYREQAESKLPKSSGTRRSSVPADPNVRPEPQHAVNGSETETVRDNKRAATVSRIHG